MKLLDTYIYTDSDTQETLELNPINAIIDAVKDMQFFSFKNDKKVMTIAAQNLGHAMSIAKTIDLGPCVIQVLDQKDGATLYAQQFLQVKQRQVA